MFRPTSLLASQIVPTAATDGHRAAEAFTSELNMLRCLCMCSEKFMPLMDALSDDVAARLAGKGARILHQIGDGRAGFHFDYKLGKTVGSGTIAPLELTAVDPTGFLGHSVPVPNCMVGVHTRIDVAEEWLAKEPGLMQISVSDSIQ